MPNSGHGGTPGTRVMLIVRKCKSLLMKFSELGRMAISRTDFCSFIIELGTRNPTMGIPALDDGLPANLLIFDYLYVFRDF